MIAGQSRRDVLTSVKFYYAQDYDDWGYSVLIPVGKHENNGVFSALNSLSAGVAVMPVYHLLHQQVHGIKLDLGGVAGYQRHWLNDKSALTDPAGQYALANFDEPESWQAGALARLAWQHNGMSVHGGVSHVEVRNRTNRELFGSGSSATSADIGVRQVIAPRTVLGLDVGQHRLHRLADSVDANYGNAGLSLLFMGKRSYWGARYQQSYGNNDYRTRQIQLMFSWLLH